MLERPSGILWEWNLDGTLARIAPDLAFLRSVEQRPAHRDNALEHTLKVVDAIAPTPVRRWAALLHDVGKGPTYIETPEGRSRFFEHDKVGAAMVPEIMLAAGADPALVEPVARLVALHMRPISYNAGWSDAAVRRLREDAEEGRGAQGWADLMALARADLRGYLPEPIDRGLWVLDSLEAHAERLEAEARRAEEMAALGPRSPLDGHSLLALAGLEPGAWVGELKSYLAAEVEAGRLPPDDSDAARRLALGWLASHKGG